MCLISVAWPSHRAGSAPSALATKKGRDFPRTPQKYQLLQVHDQSSGAQKDLTEMKTEKHGKLGGKTQQERGYKRKRYRSGNSFSTSETPDVIYEPLSECRPGAEQLYNINSKGDFTKSLIKGLCQRNFLTDRAVWSPAPRASSPGVPARTK